MRALSRRLALAALAALAAGGAWAAPPLSDPSDISLGNPKAKVHVVEYASLSCPHCANFNNTVFPAFKAKYIDTGKVRYTLREYVTDPPEVAVAGFMLARCAGPTPARYYGVIEGMFRGQALWQTGVPVVQVLRSVAAASGVNDAALQACMTNDKVRAGVNARAAKAVADGVRGTPTFFVNGRQIAEGEVSLDVLDAAVAAAGKK